MKMKKNEYVAPEMEMLELEMNNTVLVVVSEGGPEKKDPTTSGPDPD